MGAVPQDMLDRNNAAAMDINGEAIDGEAQNFLKHKTLAVDVRAHCLHESHNLI